MNGTIENQLRHIKCAVELIQRELGVNVKEVFRFVYRRLYASAEACVQARERVCARDINNNINILTKSGYVKGESMRGGEGKVADATARAPGISLGFMFRNLPQAIPHHFALWWYRSMKDRDWVLANGGFVDGKNWRYQVSAWYKHVDVNESAEAKETYERFFGKAFPRQEETAAEVWMDKCRGCDNYWAGHCVACALRPPKSAAECPRFKPLIA